MVTDEMISRFSTVLGTLRDCIYKNYLRQMHVAEVIVLTVFTFIRPLQAARSKSFQPQSNSYKAHKIAALRFEQLKNGRSGAYI